MKNTFLFFNEEWRGYHNEAICVPLWAIKHFLKTYA